jgi:hypothetical protein
MATGQRSNRSLVPGAERALEQFKYEVARQIGVQPPASGYWGELTSRDCGAVGGNMVRQMIQLAEQRLSGQAGGIGTTGTAGGAGGTTGFGGTTGGAAGTTGRTTR